MTQRRSTGRVGRRSKAEEEERAKEEEWAREEAWATREERVREEVQAKEEGERTRARRAMEEEWATREERVREEVQAKEEGERARMRWATEEEWAREEERVREEVQAREARKRDIESGTARETIKYKDSGVSCRPIPIGRFSADIEAVSVEAHQQDRDAKTVDAAQASQSHTKRSEKEYEQREMEVKYPLWFKYPPWTLVIGTAIACLIVLGVLQLDGQATGTSTARYATNVQGQPSCDGLLSLQGRALQA
ncbi:unnamed protein product [Tuber aestivum]|uniref:Uncharacterized protein n=1 Tax=Tuber aestivum TaxID=59557 RepID=A0A292PHM0_9PEZI|nr:unnamed protein product [Tuber aestivum]